MIKFHCICGQRFHVRDELAGSKMRCPKCQGVNTVPPLEAIQGQPVLPASDGPPTVSSKHDFTITPSEGLAPPRAEKKKPADQDDLAISRPKTPASRKRIAFLILGLIVVILGYFITKYILDARNPPPMQWDAIDAIPFKAEPRPNP